MALDNDTRGWIMTLASGIACIVGASIICVDVIVRLFPGKRNFKIQDSNYFLSSSLSLSFGVMLFSALYNMLPSAKSSLQKGGFSPQAAAWILIACFIAGVVGIQVISRVLHSYMPSHVVDCDHTHEDEEEPIEPMGDHFSRHHHGQKRSQSSAGIQPSRGEMAMLESAERINSPNGTAKPKVSPTLRRSISRSLSRVAELVPRSKSICLDHETPHGECKGYSEPCGFECFKIVQARGGVRIPSVPNGRPSLPRSTSTSQTLPRLAERQPLLQDISENSPLSGASKTTSVASKTSPQPNSYGSVSGEDAASDHDLEAGEEAQEDDHSHDHHHHVPTNAFMSIGLQTSIAIALHKLPEGFITYATNHANPKLGFSVFLALFIHNITEGFAMALPLYLAINSRWKAMFWSFLLGGASQPLGAGVAALWFKLAGGSANEPSEGVYGGMFAVTAGIMASVALQLFSESLDLTHNRNLCMAFAFVGMGILGISSALTAG